MLTQTRLRHDLTSLETDEMTMRSDDALPSVKEILAAESIVVVGASEDQSKFGGRLFRMLLRHRFKGRIYPVSSSRKELFGVLTYPTVAELPEAPALAVILVPRDAALATVQACVEKGAKGVIVVTAQFSDAGPEGAEIERQMVEIARKGRARLWGPNCLGIISPAKRLVLNSSLALDVDHLVQSPVGFVSQSGALMATLFDKARRRGFGFSHMISVGNQADLELCDFVDFLLDDPDTEVICTYVEGLQDPARFRAVAAKACAKGKPWLMLKSGRTEAGAQAAFSHTASLAGSFRAFEAVCEEHGIVLVDDQDAMQMLAACLVRYRNRPFRHLAVMSPSGGSAALACDRLSEAGIPLAQFDAETDRALKTVLGAPSAGNPVDFSASSPGVVGKAMELVARDGAADAALCLITTAPVLDQTCAAIADSAGRDFPTLFVIHPGESADTARAALVDRQVPYFDSFDDAIRVLKGWHAIGRCKPARASQDDERPAGLTHVTWPVGEALGEFETKAVLESYGIPVNRGSVAKDAEQAVRISAGLIFPVVVKVVSSDIVHKSDVGGVILDLPDAAAVGDAVRSMQARVRKVMPDAVIDGYLVQEMVGGGTEFIVGVNFDRDFGPMIVVGVGGVLVELLDDVAVASAPVSPTRAAEMLGSLKAAKLLQGIRGRAPLDVGALSKLVSRVSWLASDHRDRLVELDVNPVLVRSNGGGCVAVDGRALLRDLPAPKLNVNV